MGFEIVSGMGFFGAVAVVIGATALILIAIFFFSASKAAHDDVVGDEPGDFEA